MYEGKVLYLIVLIRYIKVSRYLRKFDTWYCDTLIFLVSNTHCSISSPFDNVVNDIVVYVNYHYSVLHFDVYLMWLFKKLYNIRCELFSKTLLYNNCFLCTILA